MALIPIDNVGETGIVKDINPWQLPPNVWSEGNNVRSEHGAIQKSPGYLEVMESCPIDPYSASKLSSELLIKCYSACYNNLTYIILRSANIYGYGQSENFFIPSIILSEFDNGCSLLVSLNLLINVSYNSPVL